MENCAELTIKIHLWAIWIACSWDVCSAKQIVINSILTANYLRKSSLCCVKYMTDCEKPMILVKDVRVKYTDYKLYL